MTYDQDLMFRGDTDDRRAAAIRRLKEEARGLLGAREDDAVMVNEVRCAEPGCPPLETIVALLRAGAPPRKVKVHKAAVDVTLDDLRVALASDGAGHP
ncbi:MAG: hypothetical protein ACRELB_02715 [Polyangiaceae bacterium]